MKLLRTISILIFLVLFKPVLGLNNADTTLNNHQYFGGIGSSIYGYTKQTSGYFAFYWIVGIEWNSSKSFKYGITVDAFKFNWIYLKNDSAAFKGNYDRVKYFSLSCDFQVFARKVLSRVTHPNHSYNTYIELGFGYNFPLYYSLDKINRNIVISEEYPNNYKDYYLYTEGFIYEPIMFPLGIKLEYHPFKIIKANNLPQIATFRINIEFLFHDSDH